jgi:hypothetical protein
MEQAALRKLAKRIDASDVVSLLREVYPQGVRGRNEAEALLVFDREFSDPAPEWRGFLAEAVADHLICRTEPYGEITAEKAAWLVSTIAPSGRIATQGGIEVLIRTLESASILPPSLIAFAIRELWAQVICGEGPAVQGRVHFSRELDAGDVALLHRILIAGAGKAGSAISAEEAEALFDLHDAVAAGNNHISFDDLFFRAIANYLMGASGCETRSRADALAQEPRRDLCGAIAGEFSAWLSQRIMRDGRPTPAERALLALVANGKEPDPSLRGSFDRAA